MELERTSLLLERSRPSQTLRPKARTRIIGSDRQLGPTRRSLYARIERRVRDRATPQSREVLRGLARIRTVRRRSEKPLIPGRASSRSILMKGHRL